jgi:hypothetical protein
LLPITAGIFPFYQSKGIAAIRKIGEIIVAVVDLSPLTPEDLNPDMPRGFPEIGRSYFTTWLATRSICWNGFSAISLT